MSSQGECDEAIKWYRKAIELEPTHAPAHRSLAWELFNLGKLDESIDWHRRALALDPKHPRALKTLAWP